MRVLLTDNPAIEEVRKLIREGILNEAGILPQLQIVQDKGSADIMVDDDPEEYGPLLIISGEEKDLDSGRQVYFGVRKVKKLERSMFTHREIRFEGLRNICDSVMSNVREEEGLAVFIDKSILGGKDLLSAGLSDSELIYIVQRIRFLRNVKLLVLKGFDHDMLVKLLYEIL